jgi:hypothetical protein
VRLSTLITVGSHGAGAPKPPGGQSALSCAVLVNERLSPALSFENTLRPRAHPAALHTSDRVERSHPQRPFDRQSRVEAAYISFAILRIDL